jgi:1-phosphofructokinase
MAMIITVTLNPAVDKVYWVDRVKMYEDTQEEFLTPAVRSAASAGGKGVNMSVFLSQMGIENVAMGFVGGHTGHVVVRDLRAKGVTTNFIWTRGETRTNVTVLEKERMHVPIFIDEPGSPVAPTEVDRFFRRYRRILKQATWVVLEACPHLFKPDTRKHRELMGIELLTRESIVEAGKRIVACGAEMVVISHEVTGDIAVTHDTVWEIRTPVSTSRFKNLVGADDAFLAGILLKLAEGAPVSEALRFGLAAGIASAESEEKICKDVHRIEQEMAKITAERI